MTSGGLSVSGHGVGHRVEQCEHGTVVAQCRCPGPRRVEIVACPSFCSVGVVVMDETHFLGDGCEPPHGVPPAAEREVEGAGAAAGAAGWASVFSDADVEVVRAAYEVLTRVGNATVSGVREDEHGGWVPLIDRAHHGLGLLLAMLAADGPVIPDVEWPDGVSDDPEALARTLQMLEGAEAVSTRRKVELLHPDWDGQRVDAEVKLIEGAGT